MKQNVTMNENLLIQKVIEQLTPYSNVDVSVITVRDDFLISILDLVSLLFLEMH